MQRIIIVLTAAGFVAMAIGCMSLEFGAHHEVVAPKEPVTVAAARAADDGVLIQHDSVTIAPGDAVMVYYPIPYPTPPNLVMRRADHLGEVDVRTYHIVEQRADGFRIQNVSGSTQDFPWTARGVKTAVPAAAPVLTTPVNATLLPPKQD